MQLHSRTTWACPRRAAEAAKGKVQAAAAKLTRKPAANSAPAPRAATPAQAPAAVAPATDTARIKQAIGAERARAAEIVAAGIKSGQVNQACAFAFDTNLSAKEAIAALAAAALDVAANTSDTRRIRMGLDHASTAQKSHREPTAKELADRIVAAGEKASGQTPARASSNQSANRIVAAGERARGE